MADPRKVPERLAEVYAALAPDPNAEYGALLPFARDKTTGDRRLAMPEMVRDGARGLVDLLAGTETGEVTPEAVQSLVFGGLGAGGALAPRGALAAGGAPIRAYHGSPHNFDRFDASKIGTGEGAQAFGRGMYFAENEGVAQGYRSNLSSAHPNNVRWGEELFIPTNEGFMAAGGHANEYGSGANIAMRALADSERPLQQLQFIRRYAQTDEEALAAVKLLRAREMSLTPPGHTYEVAIHEDPAKMLNWDAPMSAQPRPALQLAREFGATADMHGEPVGRDLYRRLRAATLENMPASQTVMPGAENVLTQQLLDRGVPGVRYWDQQSRAPGQGTSNYVMFPGTEESIEILRKYGMAAPTPVAAPAQPTAPRRSIFENVY